MVTLKIKTKKTENGDSIKLKQYRLKELVQKAGELRSTITELTVAEKVIKTEVSELFTELNIDKISVEGVGRMYVKSSPGRSSIDRSLLQNTLLDKGFSTEEINTIIEKSTKVSAPSSWIEFKADRKEQEEE